MSIYVSLILYQNYRGTARSILGFQMFKFAIGDLRMSEVYNAKRKKQSFPHCVYITLLFQSGPGSVVSIAICYGLGGPGIESS